MSLKDAYLQKLEARLDAVRAEIERMKVKAKDAEADARIEFQEEIETLETQRKQAEARMDELRRSGEGAWEELRTGMENAWESLETSLRRAAARFE